MSKVFQQVMNDLSSELKSVYNADDTVAIVPGSGTYGMEAVARQLAKDCLIAPETVGLAPLDANLEKGNITLKSSTVLTADQKILMHKTVCTSRYRCRCSKIKNKTQPLCSAYRKPQPVFYQMTIKALGGNRPARRLVVIRLHRLKVVFGWI
jgi:hypothetical protein